MPDLCKHLLDVIQGVLLFSSLQVKDHLPIHLLHIICCSLKQLEKSNDYSPPKSRSLLKL